ncbi:DUF2500 domain-containing protein [Bacillus sp. BHET2]|uniref:DUF2500 domain-containing protein n=1 Tax=Bacillus sp. BHET2 TaxID=2583818 RepID=UPI00110E0394|nr:DUF2500 domain-containing protein [Bacillus sp. BHET2]TMU85133.1 DUF2500 domain-containing protein [Bacillus sp. BHET2]
MYPDGNVMFDIAPIFIGVIFVIVIVAIMFSAAKGVTEWSQNNQSPKLNVAARVLAKRTNVRGGGETRAYSEYYVTFEVESGDRMELKVKDTEYGMLAEGDQGELSFQGSRYLGFIRGRADVHIQS